jgi:hypothetical protein
VDGFEIVVQRVEVHDQSGSVELFDGGPYRLEYGSFHDCNTLSRRNARRANGQTDDITEAGVGLSFGAASRPGADWTYCPLVLYSVMLDPNTTEEQIVRH